MRGGSPISWTHGNPEYTIWSCPYHSGVCPTIDLGDMTSTHGSSELHLRERRSSTGEKGPWCLYQEITRDPPKSPPALGGYPGDFLLPFGFLNSLQVQRRRIIIAFYHRERLQGHQFFTRGSFVISNDPWRVVGLKRTHPNPMYSENKY